MKKPVADADHTPPATPGSNRGESHLKTASSTRSDDLPASLRSPCHSPARPITPEISTDITGNTDMRQDVSRLTPPRTPGSTLKVNICSDKAGRPQATLELSLRFDSQKGKEGEGGTSGITRRTSTDLISLDESATFPPTSTETRSDPIKSSCSKDCTHIDDDLPGDPFYEPIFQKALNDALMVADDIADVLESCPVQSDTTISKLREEAIKLSCHELPVTRVIGVVGQSGSGKSSLINSLLDVEELALTGELGSAVTAFPIEYRYKTTGHKSAYTINATCLTYDEINEHLGELLEDYRKPSLVARDEMTADEFKATENRAEAAENIFEAAFSSMPDFDLSHLCYNTDEEYNNSLARLQGWADALDWPKGMKGGKWQSVANDPAQCLGLITPFTEKGLWPFIKIMCIFLEAPVLRNGLVFVDLPGYHDVNFARVRAARNYQATCDEVFVVAETKRAVDNPIIKEIVNERNGIASDIGKISNPNVTVICTHSAVLPEKSKKLEKLVDPRKLALARARVADIDNETFLNGREAKKAIKEANLGVQSLVIRARNAQVAQALQRAYPTQSGTGMLPVFCVDNCIYQNQDSHQAFTLSGIPQLRKYCLGLMSKALFRAADLFLTSTIPALINSVELWLGAANSITEKVDAPLKRVDAKDLRRGLEDQVDEWAQGIRDYAHTFLENPMYEDIQNVNRSAASTCRSWDAMHQSSHKAWMRNNGTYWTKAVLHKCWNTELVRSLNSVSATGWSEIDDKVESWQTDLLDPMMQCFVTFRNKATKGKAPQAFIRGLRNREAELKYGVEVTIDNFIQFFRRIKNDSTSGHMTSYMVSYMCPVYKRGAMDGGTGVTKRNSNRLQQHVSCPDFVTQQRNWATSDLAKAIAAVTSSLNAYLDDIIPKIQRDLATIQAPRSQKVSLFVQYPAFSREVEGVLRCAKAKIQDIERIVVERREEVVGGTELEES